jgi:uncharacterized membrane protein YdjX (TVP38/TMEM64 family)
MRQEGWLFKVSIVAAVAVIMAALWLVLRQLGMPDTLSSRAISDWLNSSGALGPLFLALMMMLAVVVGPIPTLPISAASGLAFGILAGTLIAMAGAMVGAMMAFFVARLLGRELLRKRLSHLPLFSAGSSQRLLFWTVFLTRVVPIFSFALVSYAAGVTAISAWRFALASLVGMLPMTLVFAGLGDTFEQRPVLSTLGAVVVLAVMTLLPPYLSRRRDSSLSRWLHLSSRR